MAHQRAPLGLHLVAAIVAELRLRVGLGQGPHEVGGMEVARSLACYQIIFHCSKLFFLWALFGVLFIAFFMI
jgi:hypothetical protein